MAFLFNTLSHQGFEVSSLYYLSESEYRKNTSSGIWPKWYLRFKLFVVYPFWAQRQLIQSAKQGDIVIATSSTFFVPLLLALRLKRRGVKVVHLLYDLFPDALEVSGFIKPSSLVSRVLAIIQRQTQKKTDGLVALGDVLLQHSIKRYGFPKQSAVIAISADAGMYGNSRPMEKREEKLTIHYGGHMGAMHESELIVKCVQTCLQEPWANRVNWVFNVSGAHGLALSQQFDSPLVRVEKAMPADQWRNQLSTFDLGLVTASTGASKLLFPSKSFGMMAGGLGMLAICPSWSDLAKTIEECQLGWVVNNDDEMGRQQVVDQFVKTVAFIVENPHEVLQAKQRAYDSMRNEFGKEALGQQWAEFLHKLN